MLPSDFSGFDEAQAPVAPVISRRSARLTLPGTGGANLLLVSGHGAAAGRTPPQVLPQPRSVAAGAVRLAPAHTPSFFGFEDSASPLSPASSAGIPDVSLVSGHGRAAVPPPVPAPPAIGGASARLLPGARPPLPRDPMTGEILYAKPRPGMMVSPITGRQYPMNGFNPEVQWQTPNAWAEEHIAPRLEKYVGAPLEKYVVAPATEYITDPFAESWERWGPVTGARLAGRYIHAEGVSMDPDDVADVELIPPLAPGQPDSGLTISGRRIAQAYKNFVAPAGEASAEFLASQYEPQNLAMLGAFSAIPRATVAGQALHRAIGAYFAGTMGAEGVQQAYGSYLAARQGDAPEAVRQGMRALYSGAFAVAGGRGAVDANSRVARGRQSQEWDEPQVEASAPAVDMIRATSPVEWRAGRPPVTGPAALTEEPRVRPADAEPKIEPEDASVEVLRPRAEAYSTAERGIEATRELTERHIPGFSERADAEGLLTGDVTRQHLQIAQQIAYLHESNPEAAGVYLDRLRTSAPKTAEFVAKYLRDKAYPTAGGSRADQQGVAGAVLPSSERGAAQGPGDDSDLRGQQYSPEGEPRTSGSGRAGESARAGGAAGEVEPRVYPELEPRVESAGAAARRIQGLGAASDRNLPQYIQGQAEPLVYPEQEPEVLPADAAEPAFRATRQTVPEAVPQAAGGQIPAVGNQAKPAVRASVLAPSELPPLEVGREVTGSTREKASKEYARQHYRELVEQYYRDHTRNGILEIASDKAKELFADFRQDPAGADRDVAAAAGALAHAMFRAEVARPVDPARSVVFVITGAPASGKSSSIRATERAGIAFSAELMLDDPKWARSTVRNILDSGRTPQIQLMSVDSPSALVRRNIGRAMKDFIRTGKPGRTVSLDYQARVFVGIPRVVDGLMREFGDRILVTTVDNSGAEPVRHFGTVQPALDAVRGYTETTAKEAFRNEFQKLDQEINIPEAIRRPALSLERVH